MADTVEHALRSPDHPSWAPGRPARDGHARLRQILGRRPTDSELALVAALGARSRERVPVPDVPESSVAVPDGMPDESLPGAEGFMDIGGGWAVSVTAGAPGAVVPVTLAAGATPVGMLTALSAGPLDAPGTARALPDAVARVCGRNNVLGVPSLGVRVDVDTADADVPIVTAFCVGARPTGEAVAGDRTDEAEAGDAIVLYGTGIGADPIDDPFLGRLLIDCTTQARAAGIVRAVRDVGDAGLAGAVVCLAGSGGVALNLDAVRVDRPGLDPREILAAGRREALVATVRPGDVPAFLDVCRRWDVPAGVIGDITRAHRVLMDWHGERVVDVDVNALNDGETDAGLRTSVGGRRPFHRPAWIDEVNSRRAEELPRPGVDRLQETLLSVLASPGICDRSWMADQFDRFVGGNAVPSASPDAGVLRIDEASGRGVALAMAGNPRQTFLNPYLGAQLALLEAYRAVAVTGARPVAAAAALAIGSGDDPALAWQAVEMDLGLADAARDLGLPILSRQLCETSTHLPVPTVAAVGVLDDVATRIGPSFAYEGDAVLLVGDTREDLSGSAWEDVAHGGHLGGMPPTVDIDQHRRLATVLAAAAGEGLLSSAHRVAAGGLGVALVEACLRGELGVALTLPGTDPFEALFSESAGRVVVSLSGANLSRLRDVCTRHQIALFRLGEVIEAPVIEIRGVTTLGLDEVRRAWSMPVPKAMGLVSTQRARRGRSLSGRVVASTW